LWPGIRDVPQGDASPRHPAERLIAVNLPPLDLADDPKPVQPARGFTAFVGGAGVACNQIIERCAAATVKALKAAHENLSQASGG
jgi:hypothetical protein